MQKSRKKVLTRARPHAILPPVMKEYTYTLIGKRGIEGRKTYTGTLEQAMRELACQVRANRMFKGHEGKQIVLWDMSSGAGVAIKAMTI